MQGCVQGVAVRSAEDLEGLDSLILPGGESTAQGHALVKADMLEPVREFAAAKPTWGVCAGMILLADELALNEAKVELGVNNGQVGFEEWMAAHFADGQGEPTATPRVDTFGF